MPPSKHRLSDVIARLEAMTRDGKLAWTIDKSLRAKRENVVGHVYWTQVKAQGFALYETKFAHHYDDDDWSWHYSVSFEAVDGDDALMWAAPADATIQEGLRSLLELVRRKTSGVDELFDDLMNGE